MKIVSWNVNGLRTRIHGDNFDHLMEQNPDIICFQETRCTLDQLEKFNFPFDHKYHSVSEKKGYSGVAIWSKVKANSVTFGDEIEGLNDPHGRIIIANFDDFTIVNVYVPNSGTNEEYRMTTWQPKILNYLLSQKEKNIIFCGDLNVAHRPIDLCWGDKTYHNYDKSLIEGNKRMVGYLPEEREFLDKLEKHYIDTYRYKNPETRDYTWWNPRVRNNAFRRKNRGMRIDYIFVSGSLKAKIKSSTIHRDIGMRTTPQGSDHCPIILEI